MEGREGKGGRKGMTGKGIGPRCFSVGLSEVGFSSDEIASVMGSNWIRLFEDVFNE